MLYVGRVKSVEGETCTVQVDDLTLSDVRLRAVVNGKESKMLITPACESYVTMIDLGDAMTDLLVIAYSEIEKVEIACDKVSFNGGNNGGLINIQALTDKLNSLITKFNTHTHNVPQLGKSLVTENTVMELERSDYEDEKVKH